MRLSAEEEGSEWCVYYIAGKEARVYSFGCVRTCAGSKKIEEIGQLLKAISFSLTCSLEPSCLMDGGRSELWAETI